MAREIVTGVIVLPLVQMLSGQLESFAIHILRNDTL